MKKLFVALLVLSSSMMFGQIAKTGGLLYSNGNPNTRGIDTLVTKNLSKNSEVCIDYSTGNIYIFDRSDSSFVKYDSRPYKVYSAILTQSGSDAPVATVLENTFGSNIVWSRYGVGNYRASSTGAFPAAKTFCLVLPESNDITAVQIGRQNYGSDDYCTLFMDEGVGIAVYIEIRVYD